MSNEDLSKVDNLEIEALSDDELNSVAGGLEAGTDVASCTCCVATAITHVHTES